MTRAWVLAAPLLLSGRVGAFSVGLSPARRAVATRLAGGGGGMDAYDAQMAALAAGGAPAPAAAPSVDEVAAAMLDSTRAAAASGSTSPAPDVATELGDADADAAVAALATSQAGAVADIAAAIPDLAPKPDHSFAAGAGGLSVAGRDAALAAYDAPGPANVAWLSDLRVDGLLSSLTVYNGPLTDVPHLVSRCVVVDGGAALRLFLDLRPRSYGAYDLRDGEGNYPGPETLGRKAFEYSGARKDFDAFATEEVVDFFRGVVDGLEGATRLDDDDLPELEKLTRGPLAIDVTMPLCTHNVNAVLAARERAASLWLEWALDPSRAHRPGAPVNTQYVYDSKYKINAYGALLAAYVELFGQAEGEKLAAAESGPLDEAYVGGGS